VSDIQDLELDMGSRAFVAQPSTARTTPQQNARFGISNAPAVHHETPQPCITFPPFKFAAVSPFALEEQALSPPGRAVVPASLPWPQARLVVGAVNDPLEREADQVADRITRTPDHASLSSTAGGEFAQRKCKSCADEEEQTVQRMCQSCSDDEERIKKDEQAAEPTTVRDVLRSPGQPLDAGTRAFFEPAFGYDFSRVRVHSDARAAASTQSVNALAYTVGRDVVFGAGQLAPQTTQGRKLLAHELAHVVQQSHMRSSVGREPGAVVQRKPAKASVEVTVDPTATCKLEQHRKIEPAVYRALAWLSRTIPAVEAILSGATTKQAKAAAASLFRHFHSTSPAVVTYIRDRLSTIESDILGRQDLRVFCPPHSDSACGTETGGQALVARVVNQNELNFCAPFFRRKEEDRASTIVHEFAHTLFGRGTREIVDREYQKDAYYYYLTTGQALTNAESYAMFVREVATGSSPAPGFIADTLDECPDDWNRPISDAITLARMWNHQAVRVPSSHEFSRAYIRLDIQLQSRFSFKCIPGGGGRCPGGHVAYWYAAGDLRICPALIALRTPDERGLALLASLYAYKSLIDGDSKQNRAAREARRLHLKRAPSTADVLRGP
jgi:Domain of unknown function (DUF4157)/Lysine-specific metallo-endopeptidase